MGVTLFTSRIVLDKLGVDDYGLYNVVGGLVAMLSFINGTLSVGTSRFISVEIGKDDKEKLSKTFNTAFRAHLFLSGIILISMETVGLWFLYHHLVIPIDRMNAAVIVFHISILTALVEITQVPYTSDIIAHEHMGIYAYISIAEALFKLGIVYLLSISHYDKLVTYAVLIAIVQILIALWYRYYCVRHFNESHMTWTFDVEILKKMLSFSGWNILANITETLKLQGVLILINMFFMPAIAGAQAIGNQVSGALMQFSNNFRSAINPQIIKSYAAGEYEASQKLTLQTTVYVFDLLLLICLPAIVIMDTLLHLWLVEVPPYAVIFTQFILLQRILDNFGASFYVPMMASGRVKSNAIACVFLGIGQFVVLYVLLKLGFGVMWIQYMGIFMICCFSFLVKPFILWREINYKIKDLVTCYFSCFKVSFLPFLISFFCCFLCPTDNIPSALLKVFFIMSSVILSSLYFMEQGVRHKLLTLIKMKMAKFI